MGYWCTDLVSLTVGSRRERFRFSLTVSNWPERFSFPLMVYSRQERFWFPWQSVTDGKGFRDGKRKTDVKDLSWRFQPSGTNPWRFSVREDRLFLPVYLWRHIPDGYRHGWFFLTVSGIFPDGIIRHEKNGWGKATTQLRGSSTGCCCSSGYPVASHA